MALSYSSSIGVPVWCLPVWLAASACVLLSSSLPVLLSVCVSSCPVRCCEAVEVWLLFDVACLPVLLSVWAAVLPYRHRVTARCCAVALACVLLMGVDTG